MKKFVKALCLTAMIMGLGTTAQAQFRQSVFLNGNIPTGDFASDASANPLSATGVPLTYTEIGKDASVGFGLGYRASYRFDVGVGEVAPFANIDFLWNTIGGGWSDKYSDAYYTTPTYFNIPLLAGVSYIYDELPWDDISAYGEFGIQALEPGWITGNQIEAARIAMTRYTKRGGKVWIKIFPDKPYSKKGLGTRMGSGKGAPEGWVAVVKNQKVMFEIGGVSEEMAREAMRLAQHKLPIKTRIIAREVETEIGGE